MVCMDKLFLFVLSFYNKSVKFNLILINTGLQRYVVNYIQISISNMSLYLCNFTIRYIDDILKLNILYYNLCQCIIHSSELYKLREDWAPLNMFNTATVCMCVSQVRNLSYSICRLSHLYDICVFVNNISL